MPIRLTRKHHYEAVIAGRGKPPDAKKTLVGPFHIEADTPDDAVRVAIREHAADFEAIEGVELIHVEELIRITTGTGGHVVETRRMTVSRVLRPIPADVVDDYLATLTCD
jgi:hypothetical protein